VKSRAITWTCAGYQRRIEIANENIAAQTNALAITQDRFAKGLTSDLDVQQASTLLATTKAEIPTLQTSLQTAIHRLGVLLGQQPGALLAELSNVAPIPAALPEVPVGLPSDLMLRRPDVQRAEQQLAAATANIGVAKADLFPKFFLTGAGGFESVSASDWFTSGAQFWSAGPTVQWRIFDAGRIRANIRVQNARQEQALDAYEQTVLTAFEEVENGLAAYANEQIRRNSLEDAVISSRNSLDLANKLYANGLTDFLHVLDAERSLYQAQDALVQSDRTVSRVEAVEIGDGEFVDAVDHARVAGGDGVEPAAAAGAAGGGAELAAHGVEHVGNLRFGGQRAFADAGGVGLHHADDAVHAVRRNAGAGAGAAGRGVGRGDEGIGAEVDVEEGALRALEEDALLFLELLVQPDDGVGDEGGELLRPASR
jgi:hypothetical protein